MNRGRLRVYLGAAPGVGKTFAMLEEGQRRAERGTDVVIGYVENHGRRKTSRAAEGLEVVVREDRRPDPLGGEDPEGEVDGGVGLDVDEDRVVRIHNKRGRRMLDDRRPRNLVTRLQEVHLVEIGLVPASAYIGLANALVGQGGIGLSERTLH